MTVHPRTFTEAEARLAETLPGYESRPQQVALANAVEAAILNRRHLLGEAGCGTGKSLATLIPAILSGKRVVISTFTRALQDQVAEKDVPFLAANLGVPFTFAVLKGRSNYLCANKAATVEPEDAPGLAAILATAAERFGDPDFTGEQAAFGVDDRTWMRLAADTEDCQAYNCREVGICYAQKARAKAKEAQVIVVNHKLFMTDLVVREMTGGVASLLDEFDVVIFDEAHKVEDAASSTLGSEFKTGGIGHLTSEVRNFGRRYLDADRAEMLATAGNRVMTAMTGLWTSLEDAFTAARSDKVRIREAVLLEYGEGFIAMSNALADLHDAVMREDLLDDVAPGAYNDVKKRQARLTRRTASTMRRFNSIITESFDDLVRWIERDGKGNLVLKTAPVTVAPYPREALFSTSVTAVLVSATLSVEGRFDYIAGRLGIDPGTFEGLDVGTPFDYGKQALFYVPTDIPDPSPANRAAWSSMMAVRMLDLVRASEGRALLLFTSFREMNAAYNAIADLIPYTVMKQGEASNAVLLERFKADTHSVLFATQTFFTGIDVQGEALSLVCIDKLPFPVPTDPIVEARTDAIKRAGGSDFKEYSIPEMSLVLKQGFGRLIRHRNDRGVFALLDPRVVTKGYGKTIVRSLPPAPLTKDATAVTSFFEGVTV